jgi:hypothetical protein
LGLPIHGPLGLARRGLQDSAQGLNPTSANFVHPHRSRPRRRPRPRLFPSGTNENSAARCLLTFSSILAIHFGLRSPIEDEDDDYDEDDWKRRNLLSEPFRRSCSRPKPAAKLWLLIAESGNGRNFISHSALSLPIKEGFEHDFWVGGRNRRWESHQLGWGTERLSIITDELCSAFCIPPSPSSSSSIADRRAKWTARIEERRKK